MARQTRQQKIEMWVEEFRPHLFMEQWDIKVVLYARHTGPESADAHASVLPQYYTLVLYVNPRFWRRTLSDADRRRTILHELVHGLTAESKMLAYETRPSEREVDSTNERLTEWITNVIWRLL